MAEAQTEELSEQSAGYAEKILGAVDHNDNNGLKALLDEMQDTLGEEGAAQVINQAKDPDGNPAVITAAAFSQSEIVGTLLEAGADPNAQGFGGKTLLETAIVNDDPDLVDAVLLAGADVNQPDEFGATPLMYAAVNGSPAMVGKMLDTGADPTLTDKEGSTAADYAELDGIKEAIGKAIEVAAPPPALAIELSNTMQMAPQ